MKKIIFILFSFLLISPLVAQVGINTSFPEKNTLLHVSEKMDDQSIIKKGIIIPRLSEKERDELTYENPLVNPKVLQLQARDNSLLIYNTTEDCYNYWNFLEQEWKSLCGKLGKSEFTFNCPTDISVEGTYIEGKEVTSNNYINIKVNVTKPGDYAIYAISGNGYSFASSGTFLDKGTFTVRLEGQGIPIKVGKDNLSISSNGIDIACSPKAEVEVLNSVATYSLNCNSIKVEGRYLKNSELTSTHKIIINVNVSKIGSYNVFTESTNGIQFKGSGKFTTTGTQQIILLGSGKPTVNDSFDIKIFSNSDGGNSLCTVNVEIMLPAMTYAVLGANNVYTWHPNNVRAKAFNSASFGPNGKVKMVSLTNSWNTTSANTAITNLNQKSKPDIILFYSYGTTVTKDLANALDNYVNQGGVLIFGTTDGNDNAANLILDGIFGEQNAKTQISGSGSTTDNVYKINNLTTDPIINGPFGNLSNQYWGEDNASTGSIVVTNLPENSVQIVSAFNDTSKNEVDPAYSLVWYNINKNFVYFGDSVGATESNTSINDYPAMFTNGIPKSKRYGQFPNQSKESRFVYNSSLELNVVAWALRRAAIAGINPH